MGSRAQNAGQAAVVDRRMMLTGAAALAATVAMTRHSTSSQTGRFRPRGTGGTSHAAFDRLLRRYVVPDGRGYNAVDYRRFRAEALPELRAYLDGLQAAVPSAFSRAEAHAYWINLYNAKTLEIVLDRYPVRSIRDINLGGSGLFGRGPWSKAVVEVEGTDLSLDDIEHEIVRPIFGDPLSHYGLNCASYSCPNLAGTAYTGSNVQALLAAGAAAYVNHPRGVAVEDRRITASKVYS
ncbi:MAG: DUF547 domain-containing protein [Rhizobiaceae bacterium]|nr:DUF547 domain-containing protein [Rhizobiaceae bacterium]